MSGISSSWEISPDWDQNFTKTTSTTILIGLVNDDSTDHYSITYKINQVTSPLQIAGKGYRVATAQRGKRAVAVIVYEA